MPAYIVGDVTVTDPDRYKDYAEHSAATAEPFGGQYIVRGGASEVLEGEWSPGRLVVIEFPSAQAARDWYASESYAALRPIRQEASRGSFVLVEGYGS